MKDMNHFSLGDIDSLFGTHLQQGATTINNAQTAINSLNPKIQFVSDHWFELVLAWFFLTMFACVLAIKITK